MEQMMIMISSGTEENPTNQPISEEPITTSTCPPTWKLYENPFYISQHHHHHHQQQQQQQQQHQQCSQSSIHRLHLPISTRKIAASFWDLTFFSRPVMDSEIEIARAQMMELKSELEFERKVRKKVESMNKKLVRELTEERKGREALERVCQELAKEISSDKAGMDKLKKEMEKERKMLRMAEVLREERVQMKLSEAKILLEETLLELEVTKRIQTSPKAEQQQQQQQQKKKILEDKNGRASLSRESSRRFVLGENVVCNNHNTNDGDGVASSMVIRKKGSSSSSEAENPHIKRGIKGFVEFPRVIRAIGSKSRHLGTKLECQKAQLRILLLKQKSPIRSNNLFIMS